jgi:LysM repeat protein
MKSMMAVFVVVTMIVTLAGCGLRTYVVEKERVDQNIAGNQGVLMGDTPPGREVTEPAKRSVFAVDVDLPAFTGPARPETGEEELEPARPWEKTSDRDVWGNRGLVSSSDIPETTEPKREPERPVAAVPARTPDDEMWGNRGFLSPREKVEEEPRRPARAERIREIAHLEELEVQRPEPAISTPVPKPKPIARKPKGPSYTEYTVKKGDTLSSIAAKPSIYGSARKWKQIYEANRDILKDSSRIYPGQVLKIPRGSSVEKKRISEAIK